MHHRVSGVVLSQEAVGTTARFLVPLSVTVNRVNGASSETAWRLTCAVTALNLLTGSARVSAVRFPSRTRSQLRVRMELEDACFQPAI